MGVDYPDVRVIVHFQAPGSIEAYYQEAGRASRDGEPGRCVLLFGQADLMTQRRLAELGGAGSAQRRDEAPRLDRAVRARERVPAGAAVRALHGAQSSVTWGAAMCVDPGAVRERTIQVREVREDRPVAVTALGAEARQLILDAVGSLRRPIGKLNLAKMLRGSKCKAMTDTASCICRSTARSRCERG
ncbi:MAG: hypothetical protein IPQ07_44800 [Myxococcales bacterium]|nr:hypothetical protein [Myxococcales bacterium]